MELLLTSCVAILGGCIGLKLRIPAGALIGAMLATALLNVTFEAAYMPGGLKFYTQVATGAYIGAKITKSDVQNLKDILKAAVILVVVMLGYAVGVGLLLHRISNLTIATTLFSMAPAGITDMTLASMDFDAEPSVVALIQTLRLIATICLLPPIIKWVNRHRAQDRTQVQNTAAKGAVGRNNKTKTNLALTLITGVVSGGVGKFLGVPGGAIAFSMAGCVAFNILTDRGYMPLKLRRFIQMFAGALIGCTIGRTQVLQMIELRVVVAIAVFSFILLDLIAAAIVSKTTGMDAVTALFSCAPGGLTDMSLIAEEMGANSLKVAGMHTIRLIAIVALYPLIIHGLLGLFLEHLISSSQEYLLSSFSRCFPDGRFLRLPELEFFIRQREVTTEIKKNMLILVQKLQHGPGTDQALEEMKADGINTEGLLNYFLNYFYRNKVSPVPLRKNFSAQVLPNPTRLLLTMAADGSATVDYIRIK